MAVNRPLSALQDWHTIKPSSFALFLLMCEVHDSREPDVFVDEAKAREFGIGRSAYYFAIDQLVEQGWIAFSRRVNGRKRWAIVKGLSTAAPSENNIPDCETGGTESVEPSELSKPASTACSESPQTWTSESEKVHDRGLLTVTKSANVDGKVHKRGLSAMRVRKRGLLNRTKSANVDFCAGKSPQTWTKKSANVDFPPDPPIRKKVLQKEETERVARDSRARGIPIELLGDHLALFKIVFPEIALTAWQKQFIRNRIRDGTDWWTALSEWKANGYRGESLARICDYYDEVRNRNDERNRVGRPDEQSIQRGSESRIPAHLQPRGIDSEQSRD